ncbi:hypothetical protein [Hoeflea sp.]|uniref:hypothetical protein n=1 Tax=Hoeflea sp. TaxID=1940281 RepID=UPI0025C02566|nr:hypothetical protein [Hoeflea sp.]
MKTGDDVAQFFGKIIRQVSGVSDGGQFVFAAKPVHPQRIFHRFAFAVEGQPARTLAGDRHHAVIDRRRRRGVQGKLMRNDLSAGVERAEIKVVVFDRTLDFEREIAGEKHVGRMRCDQFDRCVDSVCLRIAEKFHNVRLIGRV